MLAHRITPASPMAFSGTLVYIVLWIVVPSEYAKMGSDSISRSVAAPAKWGLTPFSSLP